MDFASRRGIVAPAGLAVLGVLILGAVGFGLLGRRAAPVPPTPPPAAVTSADLPIAETPEPIPDKPDPVAPSSAPPPPAVSGSAEPEKPPPPPPPAEPERKERVYAKKTIRGEPLILRGNEVLEIADTHYVMKNNVRLYDNARLVIRNSLFDHQKDYYFQYSLEAYGHSRVVVEDSGIANSCNGSLNWNFLENSSFAASGVEQVNCNIWVLTTNSASTSISGWDGFGGTTCDDARTIVENSKDLEIELCNRGGADMDIELPVVIGEYEFSGRTVPGMKNSIFLRNVTIDGWGVGAAYGDEITIRNGHAVTVSFGVGWPFQGKTVALDDLGRKHYQDRTWTMEDGFIRMVSTTVYGWETSAWAGGHTLIIRNSDFTGPTLNSGDSKVVIESSTFHNASAFESVQVDVTSSSVISEVTARENGRITIRNSELAGAFWGEAFQPVRVTAAENGIVELINTPLNGAIIKEEGNGRVIIR